VENHSWQPPCQKRSAQRTYANADDYEYGHYEKRYRIEKSEQNGQHQRGKYQVDGKGYGESCRRVLAAFFEVESHIARKSVAHIRRHKIVDYVGVRVVRKSENKAVKRIDENPCENESDGDSCVLRAYFEHTLEQVQYIVNCAAYGGQAVPHRRYAVFYCQNVRVYVADRRKCVPYRQNYRCADRNRQHQRYYDPQKDLHRVPHI